MTEYGDDSPVLKHADFHEPERLLLLDTFRQQQQRKEQSSPLILISGPSGCGKTTLAKSLKRHVEQQHQEGLFLSGKIDQFQQSNPLLGAVSECVAAIKDNVKFMTRLHDDLRLDIQVLVESMPVLREIFHFTNDGGIAPAQEGPGGQRLQFKRLFCRFLRSVCNILNRSVVLFIDDLQWAKEELFDLLSELLLDKDIRNLTVLSACREVKQDHLLSNRLREMNAQGVTITDIVLSNISTSALSEHLSSMFGSSREEVESFSSLLYQITGGNQLFIFQVVSLMLDEGLLYKQEGVWQWRQAEVRDRLRCEDILTFVAAKLRKESPILQEFLMIVSCLGNGLEESVMAAGLIVDNSTTVAEMLTEAMEQGYLVRCNQSLWSFAHDKIQHAAHDLIQTDQNEQFHLSLGRRLLKRLTADALGRHHVLVARQIIHGASLIKRESDRLDTSFFFLEAGKRAGQASTFEEAISFFNVAIDLLPRDHWESQYDLSLELYNGAAEIECALGNFDHVDRLLENALSHEMGIDDKMRSYTAQILSLGARNRLDEAIAKVKDALREAGFPLPKKKVTKARFALELLRTKAMRPHDVAHSIESQRTMQNRRMLGAVRLMTLATSYSFWKGGLLTPFLGLRVVQLSIKHGLCGMSAMGFAFYGGLLCATGSIDQGYEVGMAALRIVDRFNAREWRCRVFTFVTSNIRAWKDPISQLHEIAAPVSRIGLDTGDTEFAMLSLGLYLQQGFDTAPSLKILFDRLKASHELMDRYKQTAISAMFAPLTQSVANLLGEYHGKEPWILTGAFMREAQDEASLQKAFAANLKVWMMTYCGKCFLALILGEFEEARLAMKRLSPVSRKVESEVLHPTYSSNYCLNYALSHLTDQSRRPNYKGVRRAIRGLKRLALRVPEINSCKLYFAQAELCHRMGKYNEATFYYESACATAQKDGVVYITAFCKERVSALKKATGKLYEARQELINSRSEYDKWGCAMKVRQLDAALEKLDS